MKLYKFFIETKTPYFDNGKQRYTYDHLMDATNKDEAIENFEKIDESRIFAIKQ